MYQKQHLLDFMVHIFKVKGSRLFLGVSRIQTSLYLRSSGIWECFYIRVKIFTTPSKGLWRMAKYCACTFVTLINIVVMDSWKASTYFIWQFSEAGSVPWLSNLGTRYLCEVCSQEECWFFAQWSRENTTRFHTFDGWGESKSPELDTPKRVW